MVVIVMVTGDVFISSGHYMYIEATGRSRGDKAQLLSPRYPRTTGRCLQFWYHMHGADIGTLTVYKKVCFWGQLYAKI